MRRWPPRQGESQEVAEISHETHFLDRAQVAGVEPDFRAQIVMRPVCPKRLRTAAMATHQCSNVSIERARVASLDRRDPCREVRSIRRGIVRAHCRHGWSWVGPHQAAGSALHNGERAEAVQQLLTAQEGQIIPRAAHGAGDVFHSHRLGFMRDHVHLYVLTYHLSNLHLRCLPMSTIVSIAAYSVGWLQHA